VVARNNYTVRSCLTGTMEMRMADRLRQRKK
jgi:hypothetical protein